MEKIACGSVSYTLSFFALHVYIRSQPTAITTSRLHIIILLDHLPMVTRKCYLGTKGFLHFSLSVKDGICSSLKIPVLCIRAYVREPKG